ncbi:MAG: helix-turn-helix domain-containing protein [Ruminococcaceae bacterium]|nr:helix-turn-helix domain-containing protein [Oscillospiraceae bacterium]
MTFDKIGFGKRLYTVMKENGDTIYSLAAYLGLKPSTVSRYNNGLYVPKAPVLDQICRRYGISPHWLMGEDVPKTPPSASPACQVPVLGDVAAGTPIWAEENYDGHVAVDPEERVDFALRIRGDSMTGARIFNGDLVYVRRQPQVENGEIAVVLVDGEATVKRVFDHPDRLVLRPENEAFSDMIYKKDTHDLSVLGKVIFVKGRVE